MKFKTKQISIVLFAFIFLQVLFLSNVFANNDTGTVTIKVPVSNNMQDVSGRVFEVYKISNSYPNDEQKLLSELSKRSDAELKKAYSYLVTNPTVYDKEKDAGIVNVTLSNGTYLVKEVDKGKSPKVESFLIIMNLSQNKDFVVLPKYEYETPDNPPPPPEETVELLKVSDKGDRLKGVGFRLYRVYDKSYEEVPLRGNVYDPNGSKNILYTDSNGKIIVRNLPKGKYVFREVQALDGYKIVEKDNSFEIYSIEGKRIKVVNVKEEKPKYGVKFIKTDENGISLQGAEFKVYEKIGNQEKPVLKNGKFYIVKSGADGRFVITDLDKGSYVLWETEAPKGYIKSNKKFSFEINEDSYDKGTLQIKNEKEKTPVKEGEKGNKNKPLKRKSKEMPKTGDITLIISSIAGIILIVMGSKMILSKDED